VWGRSAEFALKRLERSSAPGLVGFPGGQGGHHLSLETTKSEDRNDELPPMQ